MLVLGGGEEGGREGGEEAGLAEDSAVLLEEGGEGEELGVEGGGEGVIMEGPSRASGERGRPETHLEEGGGVGHHLEPGEPRGLGSLSRGREQVTWDGVQRVQEAVEECVTGTQLQKGKVRQAAEGLLGEGSG